MSFRPEVYRQESWKMLGYFLNKESANKCVEIHQASDGPYAKNPVRIATVIGNGHVVNVRHVISREQKMENRRFFKEAKEAKAKAEQLSRGVKILPQ